jgi:hypothetical protein
MFWWDQNQTVFLSIAKSAKNRQRNDTFKKVLGTDTTYGIIDRKIAAVYARSQKGHHGDICNSRSAAIYSKLSYTIYRRQYIVEQKALHSLHSSAVL